MARGWRLDLGRRPVSATTTARSRSTAGWRDGVATRAIGDGWPPASPAIASSATTTRSARRSSASTSAGWSSPTRPDQTSPPAPDAGRPARMQVRIVRRAASYAGAAKPRRRR